MFRRIVILIITGIYSHFVAHVIIRRVNLWLLATLISWFRLTSVRLVESNIKKGSPISCLNY